MSEVKISSRYATSLVELAREKNLLEQVYHDIRSFGETLASSPDLVNVLKSPVIFGDKKIRIIREVFGKTLNPLTLTFMEIVVKKRREAYLSDIAVQFISQYNAIRGISSATVTTAAKLNDATVALVKSFIEKQTGTSIDLKVKVDPAIIGGLVIRIGDQLFDSSIANKINKLKPELVLN